MNKIVARTVAVLLIMGVMAGDAMAVCNGAFVNPLTETSWTKGTAALCGQYP